LRGWYYCEHGWRARCELQAPRGDSRGETKEGRNVVDIPVSVYFGVRGAGKEVKEILGVVGIYSVLIISS
jgi:hypothetical protein